MKILFITHDTTRSGAPLVLLYFIKWLKEHHSQIKINLLALKGGELDGEFMEQVDCFYRLSDYKKEELTFIKDAKKRTLKKIGLYKERPHPKEVLLKKLAFENFDLIYANTVVSIPIAVKLKTINTNLKVVAHIHELDMVIKLLLPNLERYADKIDGFVSASNLVKNNLVNEYQISSEKIKTVYEFSRMNFPQNTTTSEDHFIVCGSGKGGWRKGSDLFIQVANYIKSNYPQHKIKFKWIGGNPPWENLLLKNDIVKSGLNEIVNFLGNLNDPGEVFFEMDIFLMTSREDPFPLVCIEAGMLGKPIIGFKGATGTEEVLPEMKENFVPYLSIESMAEKIVCYYEDKQLLQRDGEYFKAIFSNFTPDKICPLLYDHLKQI